MNELQKCGCINIIWYKSVVPFLFVNDYFAIIATTCISMLLLICDLLLLINAFKNLYCTVITCLFLSFSFINSINTICYDEKNSFN